MRLLEASRLHDMSSAGQVHRHQRRGARGIHRHRRTLETQHVRQPPRRDRVTAARRGEHAAAERLHGPNGRSAAAGGAVACGERGFEPRRVTGERCSTSSKSAFF